jgi:hypothetical protein
MPISLIKKMITTGLPDKSRNNKYAGMLGVPSSWLPP